MVCNRIVNPISTSDFRGANQVTPIRKSRHSLWLVYPNSFKKKKQITNGPHISNKSLTYLLQWYDFSRKNQKLSKLHPRILRTLSFHSFNVLMLILYSAVLWVDLPPYGTLITITIVEFRRMSLSVIFF